jgi:hypothetical protein
LKHLNESVTYFVEYSMVAKGTDKFILAEVEDLLDGMTDQVRRSILSVRTQRESESMKSGQSSHEKITSFSYIDIREYPMCIGDNPGGSVGTPLSIEWKHVSEVQIGLEEYEDSRPERRSHSALAMGETVRYEILRRSGYTRKDIQSQTKPVNIERAGRKRTLETLNLARLHEFREALSRKTLNVLSFGARKRKERMMMESFASPELKGRERESDKTPGPKGCEGGSNNTTETQAFRQSSFET